MMRFIFLISFLILPLSTFAADTSFVPLTSFPGLTEGGNAANMKAFLNSVYKICIGAAAAIAVLQIIRAGILFMTNKGSVSENEQARELLQGAVLGLILVLSPVIVFSIINPKILTLDFGVGSLKQEHPATGSLGSSVTEQVVESVTTSIANACGVTMTAEQKTCVDNKAKELQAAYAACMKAAGADTKKQDECSKTLQSSGAGAANSCISGLTSTQTTCIANQIGQAVQVTNGGSAGTSNIKYGWIDRFCADSNGTPPNCTPATEKGGPYTTQSACFAAAGSDPAKHGRGPIIDPPGFSCTCDKPVSEQGSACATI